ncbi:MAG: AAA family ATPase [Clostridia bacterium]|nr:AAA family ATPase [Clostridia bacterium]
MNAFDRIIGYKSIKRELITLADMMKNGPKYTKLGVKLPRGILLCGEPGVGKTLMANCLLEESGRNVFVLRKDKPNGDFVNAIQEMFVEAKKHQPSIVLLDDLDKFSSDPHAHSDAEEYVLVQTCMDDTGEDDVFVVATANRASKLPHSLLREGRLGRTIDVLSPKGKDAVEIIRHFLAQKAFVGEVNVEDVAKMLDGDSCAMLEEVINEAGIYAGVQGKEKIDMDDLIRGIMRIKFSAPESEDEVPESVLRATAYHEAGHTIVAEHLSPGSVGLVSVLSHDGSVKGVTNYYQDDRYWDDKVNMENRVIALLGGKAATELVYGKTDVGATSDVGRAFDIVDRFVDDYCSLGFDSFERRESTQVLMARKEARVECDIERYYATAKKILIDNRAFLDALANALVEKKTLVSSDIQKLKESVA